MSIPGHSASKVTRRLVAFTVLPHLWGCINPWGFIVLYMCSSSGHAQSDHRRPAASHKPGLPATDAFHCLLATSYARADVLVDGSAGGSCADLDPGTVLVGWQVLQCLSVRDTEWDCGTDA